jgi:hypothetical protein
MGVLTMSGKLQKQTVLMADVKITVTFLVLGILISFFFGACSKSKSPLEPAINEDQDISQDLPETIEVQTENRTILAAYDVMIDPKSKTFEITPFERNAKYHYPVSNLYPNVLTVTDYGFTPNLWADIKLQHPLPGSGIDGFDPRVIAILPANDGARFIYPLMGISGNNAVVLEPDGYTRLFDDLGGSILGNVNPFKAYFKDQPYRRFSSTVATEETQRWQMNINGFSGPMQFKLVIDISTNYPDPPEPITDNAPEPIEIDAVIYGSLTVNGGDATVEARIKHWQSYFGLGVPIIESPDLLNDTLPLNYYSYSPYFDASVFKNTITNEKLAPEGEYHLMLKSWDESTGIEMFNEFNARVSNDINFNPVDVTPPWLNISAQDVCVKGNYAYLSSLTQGLIIYDVTNPEHPIWVNTVDTPGASAAVFVTGGYAYVAECDYQACLQIIDIDPPENAHIVKSVSNVSSENIFVADGYAYVSEPIKIIDIDPPEDAHIVKTFYTQGNTGNIQVIGDYAYVAGFYQGLHILDINPPESAYIVNTVDTPRNAEGVFVYGGYAYVKSNDPVYVIDIDPPESAHIVTSVDIPAEDVYITGGYAYVATLNEGFLIIDIDPLGLAHIVNTVDINARDVYVTGGYAYIVDIASQLRIIDINPPENAYIVNPVRSIGAATDVYADGNYGYVRDSCSGLMILDINSPENTICINAVNIPGTAYDFHVESGYAYVIAITGYPVYNYSLQIIDIDPPESADIVNSIDINNANRVYVQGEYAYVTSLSGSLLIIDIDPPENAYVVNSVDGSSGFMDVHVTDGYAYVPTSSGSLMIIDIDPPENAYVVNTFDAPDYLKNVEDIYATGGYAYVAVSDDPFNPTAHRYLQIIDVIPPETAHIVNSVYTHGSALGVHVDGGYAYVAASNYGLRIIDIDPPESAGWIKSFYTPYRAVDVHTSNGYAYVVDSRYGLRIIDLW